MVLRGELLAKPTYQVIQTIQEGNTSICHKCWHELFECHCVQKTVNLLGVNDALAYNEPKLLKSLKHPRLAEVWEAQWDPDMGEKYVTFTMPFYEGGSLCSVLLDGVPFSIGQAINVVSHVLDALHFLHVERKIVHRDIKPGNIFLAADGSSAFLGDLGGAAPLVDGWAAFKGGTPLYLAPESVSNKFTPRSDLYSLGLVLLEMLGGRFAYERLNMRAVERRLSEGMRALSGRDLQPPVHTPSSLHRLLNQMLHADPSRRPDSALTVQRELQNVVHLDWRPVSVDEPRTWLGSAPQRRRGRPPRDVEVTANRMARGRYAGLVELSARWRDRDALRWRGMNSLKVRIREDDQAGWRAFFKSVSSALRQS